MASETQISILVSLKDQASAELKKMGNNLSSSLEAAKGASFAFTGAIGAVGYGLFSAARAAEEADKVHRQLDAVLKSTGGAAGVTKKAAEDLAAEMQKLTNYDDETVLSAENLLLTFTKIGKDVFPNATKTVLDMSAALGQDTKSSAIQLGKALNDPVEGINALRRVGVSFSNDQQEVIKKLVETGRLAEAQGLILKELQTEFGGSAEALADPWIQMKNALSDAWETAGQQLKPALDSLAQTLTTFATDVLPSIINGISSVVGWFKEHEWAIYAVAGAIMAAMIPAIWSMVAGFAALAISLAPFLIGGAIIGLLIAGIVWIIQHWDLLKAKAVEIWEGIKNFLAQHIGLILLIFTGGIGNIVKLVIDNWENIKNNTKAIWEGIAGIISGVWEGIKQTIKDSINWVIEKMNSFIEKANNAMSKVTGALGIKKSPTIPKIPMLAKGGIVDRPTLAMIGEAGPEAVIPLSRMGQYGAGGMTVVINGPVMTGPEYARELGRELALEIKRQVRI